MAIARLEEHRNLYVRYSEPIDHLSDELPHQTVLELKDRIEVGGFWIIPGIPRRKGPRPTLMRSLPQAAEESIAIEPLAKSNYNNHPGCPRKS